MARRMIEKRRRGFFGYAFLSLFWAYNIFMLYAFLTGLGDAGSQLKGMSGAEKTGGEIGMVMGATFVLGVWALGAVILGLFCILTRGQREWIEISDDSRESSVVQALATPGRAPPPLPDSARTSEPPADWKRHDAANRVGAVVAIIVIIALIALTA